jgi:hypothetical protein
MQEDARSACESLKADVSALRRLSDATFSQIPADVAEALAGAADEHKRLRLQLLEQQNAMRDQLQQERKSSQQLLEKERAALQAQMEVSSRHTFLNTSAKLLMRLSYVSLI